MFRFISETTFYGIIFYAVTLMMGVVSGIAVARFEREGGSKALLRNLLNITKSNRFTDTIAYVQIKERLEAWEEEENEQL